MCKGAWGMGSLSLDCRPNGFSLRRLPAMSAVVVNQWVTFMMGKGMDGEMFKEVFFFFFLVITIF